MLPDQTLKHTAAAAEYLTGAIEAVSESSGINQAFLGLIVLPIAGNAAEHITVSGVGHEWGACVVLEGSADGAQVGCKCLPRGLRRCTCGSVQDGTGLSQVLRASQGAPCKP